MSTAQATKKLHIATFGCQMNVYDSDRMAGLLEPLGYRHEDNPELADVILLNTCSVRQNAEHKVYSYMGHLKSLKAKRPNIIIGLGGCMAQQEGKRLLADMPHLDIVFGTGQLDRLPELIADAAQGVRSASLELGKSLPNAGAISPARVGLKAHLTVMRGCDNFCSYCVVPHTRGREHSRPAAEVAAEARALCAAGAREITLLGQNVNSYRDPGGIDFAGLLEMVAEVDGLWRLRFVTSHPKDMSDSLVEAMASIPQVMEQIHLPAQSGSNRILKAMNRRYTREQYLERAAKVRDIVPDAALGGDIIVGFPGESDRDFEETLSLLEQVRYDYLFSFKYSDRPFTKAGGMSGKLEERTKAERLDRLQNRQREISLEINQGLKGRIEEVLVEGPARHGEGLMCGRTRSGRMVNFPGGPELTGSLVEVEVIQGRVHSLMGRLLPRRGGEK